MTGQLGFPSKMLEFRKHPNNLVKFDTTYETLKFVKECVLVIGAQYELMKAGMEFTRERLLMNLDKNGFPDPNACTVNQLLDLGFTPNQHAPSLLMVPIWLHHYINPQSCLYTVDIWGKVKHYLYTSDQIGTDFGCMLYGINKLDEIQTDSLTTKEKPLEIEISD